MNNIIFIGSVYSEDKILEYQKKCKKGFQFASQALQESILRGFIANGVNLNVLSFPSLPTYPKGYKNPIIKTDSFYIDSSQIGYSIGRINLPILRANFQCLSYVKKWISESIGKKTVFIYGLNPIYLELASKIKKLDSSIKVCLMVPDLLEFTGVNKYYKMLGLRRRQKRIINKYINEVDSYVYLSKYMEEKFPSRPSIVIEGIYNGGSLEGKSIEKDDNKNILYTGNIDERYGIMDLVKAFLLIKDPSCRLWICGFGDTENKIKELSIVDDRIVFMGSLPRVEVLKLQRKATLLVNPRHSTEEYTKYSFPSKTMEYLASGTPTLMCRLKCIPEEYFYHLYFIDDESVEGYKDALVRVLSMDSTILEKRGKDATTFILEEKNNIKQVERIVNFL